MIPVSSCGGLAAALKAAVAGAVITIAPGTYPACGVSGVTLPAGVSVQAAGASFTSMTFNAVANLTWSGGKTTGGQYYGWALNDVSNFTLAGVSMINPVSGISIARGVNVAILDCTITGRNADGVDIAGGSGILVSGCQDSGYAPAGNMQHPDFIQGWATAATPLAHVTLVGNTMVSSNAPVPSEPPSIGSQGIDVWNDNGPGGGPLAVSDIHILGNTVETYGGAAAALFQVADPTSEIRGNLATTLPGAPWATRIVTTGSQIGAARPNTLDGVVH